MVVMVTLGRTEEGAHWILTNDDRLTCSSLMIHVQGPGPSTAARRQMWQWKAQRETCFPIKSFSLVPKIVGFLCPRVKRRCDRNKAAILGVKSALLPAIIPLPPFMGGTDFQRHLSGWKKREVSWQARPGGGVSRWIKLFQLTFTHGSWRVQKVDIVNILPDPRKDPSILNCDKNYELALEIDSIWSVFITGATTLEGREDEGLWEKKRPSVRMVGRIVWWKNVIAKIFNWWASIVLH